MNPNIIILVVSHLAVFVIGWLASRRFGFGPQPKPVLAKLGFERLSRQDSEIAAATLNYLIKACASTIERVECDEPAVFIQVAGRNPESGFLDRIDGMGRPVRNQSDYRHGSGVLFFIEGAHWGQGDGALVQAGYVAGPLWAMQMMLVLKEDEGVWTVRSASGTWLA